MAAAPSEVGIADDRAKLNFARHHAFIIGINAYQNNISPLKTAVADATRLGEVLSQQHHFEVHGPLLDARGGQIREWLNSTLREEVGADDRVLFYFAGHGIATDGDDGPAGYIVPADAEPDNLDTLIQMADLQATLDALPCRHLLLILDCCFSGAFKWSSLHRAMGTWTPKRIYEDRFRRFVDDPARQIITSAAYDQKALDVLHGKATGFRDVVSSNGSVQHSPFALALFDGLEGKADIKSEREGDGVITATELYCHIRDLIEPVTLKEGEKLRQTPSFFPLKGHDKGEFMFIHPRHRLNLPTRSAGQPPFKGLASFDETDKHLFYGRDRVIAALKAKADDPENRLLVVLGASGTGKSSVVKAGLLPLLRASGLQILPTLRPGAHPMAALAQALGQVLPRPDTDTGAAPAGQAVLLIDQYEELISRCADPVEREAFDMRLGVLLDDSGSIARIIITVRSDFEPLLSGGALKESWRRGRYTVPPFSLDELREVIVMPTIQEVLIFDPPELVDRIIGEVVQSPGALPLLSYTLSELYAAYLRSGRSDRALRADDYERLGGVMGALSTKADMLFEGLDGAARNTMRKIMLRMVSVESDLASRRVPFDDLDFSNAEAGLVNSVLDRLDEARLIVRGQDEARSQRYVEPAHDALVRAWKTLHQWIHETGKDKLILIAKVNAAAHDFARSADDGLLWSDSPYLPLVHEDGVDGQPLDLNAAEADFIHKSVARRNDKALQAEREKVRVLLNLFSSLQLFLKEGRPGSVCVRPTCATAPVADGGQWIPISRLPEHIPTCADGPPASRDFIVARHCDAGRVLVYAHDGLTKDSEIRPESDNLVFAENALRWLAPSDERGGTIVLWPGTYLRMDDMKRVREFAKRRRWLLTTATPATLEAKLTGAGVLWYVSDWNPPKDFATRHVPIIEKFVRQGGGLLVAGLGWSYQYYAETKPPPPYAADELGKAFGFSFTNDAFQYDVREPIPLDPGR